MPRLFGLLALIIAASLPALVVAKPLDAGDGIFVTVPNPITSSAVNRVISTIDRAAKDRKIRTVVLDFNPDRKPASSRDFGTCWDLAEYLRSKPELMTVAFLSNGVSRHTVLPVLACRQIVMSSDATIGEIVSEGDQAMSPGRQAPYEAIVKSDRKGLWPIVNKMWDRNIDVVEGSLNDSVWYVDRRKEADAIKEGVRIVRNQVVLPAGQVANLTAAEAQKFGLCAAVRDSRQQVAEFCQLPPTSLRDDILQGRTPNAWRITVRGTVTPGLVDTMQRRLDRLVRRGANLIVLQLECGGGSTESARALGDFIRDLRDRGPDGMPVMTIAYIPREAPDTATFIALGCSEIVMAKDARLGDFDAYMNAKDPDPRRRVKFNVEATRDSLRQLAESQGYSPLLFQGLLDKDIELVRVRNAQGNAIERRIVLKADAEEKGPDGNLKWKLEDTIKPAGELLKLTASRAKDCNVARHVVDAKEDVAEVCRIYGVEPSRVQEAGPDWLDRIATFLADPTVSVIIIMIGIAGLILELKLPGVSLPGVVAAICFVLFFWSQSQMNGQITLLAVLLFILGLVLIGVEIFIIPGFGFVGFSGIALMLIGLGLATVERMPQTSSEWWSFSGTITTFGGALLGSLAIAFFAARFLPHVPYANRLVLAPPGENTESLEELSPVESLAHLLGVIGTAATMLRPSGMAKFADAYVDVVTEGGFIPAGARVQVVEIEGNRVVVKEV